MAQRAVWTLPLLRKTQKDLEIIWQEKMVSTATPRTYGRTSIASKIGWRSKDSRHRGYELFGLENVISAYRVATFGQTTKVSTVWGGHLLALSRSVEYSWSSS
jgi:hypothetical protein